MTIAEFYRSEADRCQRRSAHSADAERAEKWHALANEYLYFAQQLDVEAQPRTAR